MQSRPASLGGGGGRGAEPRGGAKGRGVATALSLGAFAPSPRQEQGDAHPDGSVSPGLRGEAPEGLCPVHRAAGRDALPALSPQTSLKFWGR